MGARQRDQQNEPFDPATKDLELHKKDLFHVSVRGLALLAFTTGFVLLIGALVSCSSPAPKAPLRSLDSATYPETQIGRRLTSSGYNHRPQLSADGEKILFLSSQRPSHKQSQVYMLDLMSDKERRLTFHDGDCEDVSWTPKTEKLLYASTTDELKERPRSLNEHKSPLPPTELYLSDFVGSDIQRLTEVPGYQSEVSWVSPQIFLFTSEDQGKTRIDRFELGAGRAGLRQKETPAPASEVQNQVEQPESTESVQTDASPEAESEPKPQPELIPSVPTQKSSHKISLWRESKSENLRRPTVDASGSQVAWVIQTEKEPPRLGLKLKGAFKEQTLPFADIQSLSWMSDGKKSQKILMSAKKPDQEFHSLWILNLEKKCLTDFLREPQGALMDAQISSQKSKLVMSLRYQGSSQIYLRELSPNPEELPCAAL